MDDGPDTEGLGRLASLDIAGAAYLQAIVEHLLRNIQFRQGARIIKRHDGEPPKGPNLKSWSAHLIGRQEDATARLHRGGERTRGDRGYRHVVRATGSVVAWQSACGAEAILMPSNAQRRRSGVRTAV
jgi:hypothetical protein